MSNINIEYLAIEQLVLDPRNPRVAPTSENLADGESVTEDFIELALGIHDPTDDEGGVSSTFSGLKASIRAYGGIIQPIVVTPTNQDKFIVIEGNTRVAIFRKLLEEGAPGDWRAIPAIVRRGIMEADEHAIRLQAHLVGPRAWRPYAKAKYLHHLYTDEKLSIQQILEYCGGNAKKREIESYIQAYKEMQKHYMPVVDPNPPDYSRFSAFVELQKPQIKGAILKSGFTLNDFGKWVHEDGKLSPLNTVRQLPRILANSEARKKFLSQNAREAMRLLEQPSTSAAVAEASLEQLATALATKIRALNWPEVKGLSEDHATSASQALSDCFDELQDLCKQTGILQGNE